MGGGEEVGGGGGRTRRGGEGGGAGRQPPAFHSVLERHLVPSQPGRPPSLEKFQNKLNFPFQWPLHNRPGFDCSEGFRPSSTPPSSPRPSHSAEPP